MEASNMFLQLQNGEAGDIIGIGLWKHATDR
jgi:hypothetical protein